MKRGFTLTELLIVLAILAALTLVAVQSLQPLAEQARYEATKTTLQRIEEAVMGPENFRQTDGTPIISGFVADVGRLPLAQSPAPGFELAELWASPLAGSFPYGLRQGPGPESFNGVDFRDIWIPCGWRGPYLQPPTAADGLRDGWGKPLGYIWANDPATAPAKSVNPQVTLTVAADLIHELPTVVDMPRMLSLVSLIGSVTYADGVPAISDPGKDITVTVYLIHPDPANASGELSVVDFHLTDADPNFVFTSVAPGLRALRAVVRRNGTEFADKTVYRHVLRNGLSGEQIRLDVNAPEEESENE